MALEINAALSSTIIDTNNARMIRQGENSKVDRLIEEMQSGQVGVLMTAGVNPVYSLPNAEEFTEAMQNVDATVAFSMKLDETATQAKYVASTPHYLESWGDVQLTKNTFSLVQPTIQPLF